MSVKTFIQIHIFLILTTMGLTMFMIYLANLCRSLFAVGGEWTPLVLMGLYLLCDWHERKEEKNVCKERISRHSRRQVACKRQQRKHSSI